MKKLVVSTALVGMLASCTTLRFDFFTPDYSSSGTGGTGGGSGGGTGGSGGAQLCVSGSTQPCYTGALGTEGKGICHGGMQTCAVDGMSWGACLGEQVPQTENCATPEDEDCDGLAPPCKGNLLWAKRFGDSSEQQASSVVADASGNVLITGLATGVVDFGGGPLSGGNVFVAKFDPDGNHLWSNRFGSGSGFGLSVATDINGNVLATGYFGGTIDFGGGPLASTGSKNMYLAKLDPTGAHLWSKRIGDANTAGLSVALDGSGNVYVTGYFGGSLDFGGSTIQSTSSKDIFVAKLDANGNYVWGRGFGRAVGQSVAADSSGNVLVTGSLNGTADFGGGPLVSAGGTDVFVAKLDGNGGHLWSRRFGDSANQGALGVVVDSSDNAVITGYFSGTIDFGSGALQGNGEAVFLAKFDSGGSLVWGKRFGDSGIQTSRSVACDKAGNIAITGDFGGQIDFGGGPLQSAGGSDVFIAKLDAAGEHQWSKRFGDPTANQEGYGVAMDSGGSVVVTGYFGGATDFGGGALMSAGMDDGFVAKFGP